MSGDDYTLTELQETQASGTTRKRNTAGLLRTAAKKIAPHSHITTNSTKRGHRQHAKQPPDILAHVLKALRLVVVAKDRQRITDIIRIVAKKSK